MQTPSSRLITLILGLSLLLAAVPLSATVIPDDLREQVLQKIDRIEKDGPNMAEMMAALREAGASYLPELVAPIDVDKYQDMERRRMILGVYLLDMTYAGVFHQTGPAARYGQAVFQLLSELGFPMPEREREYREALDRLDEPGGEEQMRDLFNEQMNDTAWQEMLDTEDGLDLVVNALYGFLVEGMYLAAELGILSHYDARFLGHVSEMRVSFRALGDVLDLFKDDPRLSPRLRADDRLRFIASLLQLFGDTPIITPELLDNLRPMIREARDGIVR